MPSSMAGTQGWRELHRLLGVGYKRRSRGADAAACEPWLDAWSLLLRTMDESSLSRLAEIDQELSGRPFISTWVPDLHMTLWNAGLKEPRFLDEGVRFTAEFLRRFEGQDEHLTQDVRCALASFHAQLGRFETADELFHAWLTADPQWGWGWIRWAECYSFRPWDNEQLAARGVEILRQGAAAPGVHHLKHLLADLESLLADLLRDKESRAVRRRLLALTEDEPEEQPRPLCELPSWLDADRLILDGYDQREAGDRAGACRSWLAAWPSFLQAMDESGIHDFDDFDDHVSGYGYVASWARDLANEVWAAARQDPQSFDAGIRFTTEFLRRFETHAGYPTEDVRWAHGLLHASAGRLDDADAMFRRWLADDPRWGWGWIRWAACHTYAAPDGMSDDERALEILQQGAAVLGLRDAREVLEELADQFSFVGRGEEAEEVRRRRAELPEEEPDEDELRDDVPPESAGEADPGFRESPSGGEPLRVEKTGRNAPCPCGSGRKFKKCCSP